MRAMASLNIKTSPRDIKKQYKTRMDCLKYFSHTLGEAVFAITSQEEFCCSCCEFSGSCLDVPAESNRAENHVLIGLRTHDDFQEIAFNETDFHMIKFVWGGFPGSNCLEQWKRMNKPKSDHNNMTDALSYVSSP